MSKDISDKKTYSVDEMMDSLRDQDREKKEEGELITREDGTQVMRVKKRRRRTKQKKQEAEKRRKRFKIMRVLAVITIPLVLGLGIVVLLASYHSSGFGESVVATLWKKTGASAKISNLSPMGSQVTAKSFSLSWPDGELLEQLKVIDVSGDLNLVSFATGKLKGTELNASQGQLLVSERTDRKVGEPKGEAKKLPGFQRYTCDYFSFYFGSARSPFRLEGSKVRFIPTNYSKQIHLTGGELAAGSWGVLPLKRGTLEFLNETIKVISLRFEDENQHMILSGDLALSDSIHSLTVEAERGTIKTLGGFELDRLFKSQLDGATGTLVFRPWSPASHELTLACEPEYVTLKNFAFLKVLEDLYGDSRFEELEFELEEDFEIIRGSDEVKITGLELFEVGLVAVTGEVIVKGDQLSGKLRVGLPDHKKLSLRATQRKEFFAKGTLEDGFFWFDLEVGGSPSSPTDSFLSYLEGSGRPESTEELFEQLTR